MSNHQIPLHNDKSNLPTGSQVLKSTGLIILLTAIFGGLSYALIELNNRVMQLTIPESVWCGLAMALAVAYYLWQRPSKPRTESP